MQTIVKAANEAGLLALMPHVLGIHPSNSVVLLAFRGNRTHGAFRFDLPQPTTARPALIYKRISRAYVRMLEKLPTADGVAVVVVTNDVFGESTVPPRLDLAVEITRTIEHSRFTLKSVLCQAGDGWAPYFDQNVPPGGYSLADVSESDTAAQLPPDLLDLMDSAAVPPRVPDASDALKSRVMSDYQRISLNLDGEESRDASPPAPGINGTFDELVEDALDFSDEEFERFAGLFLAAAQNPLTSTLMMAQWASKDNMGSRLWHGILYPTPENAGSLAEFRAIVGGFARQPDPERLKHAIAFVSKLVSCADDVARAVPLYVLGWLHWALGHGTLASVHLAEAIRLAPELRLAADLESAIRNGVLPDWAFDTTDDDDDDDDDDDVEVEVEVGVEYDDDGDLDLDDDINARSEWF
jgi:hypothetical protein